MIIKLDHVAFATDDFDRDLRRLKALGYQVQFEERDLHDLENKRQNMRRFDGKLSMALLTRPGSIPIEVLDHGHITDDPPYLIPGFETRLLQGQEIGDRRVFKETSFSRQQTQLGDVFVGEEADAESFDCSKVFSDAPDPGEAVDFWLSLGFKAISADSKLVHLEFRSFLSGRLDMYIRRSDQAQPEAYWLDAHGFNCLAFVSSDLQKGWNQFEELGWRPTEPNTFRVNGKELLIYWIKGPGGEIVEIITPAQRQGASRPPRNTSGVLTN